MPTFFFSLFNAFWSIKLLDFVWADMLDLQLCHPLQIASEGLKHRVFECSLADLQNDEDQSYRKIRLRAEDVQGKNVLTNFWVTIKSSPSL